MGEGTGDIQGKESGRDKENRREKIYDPPLIPLNDPSAGGNSKLKSLKNSADGEKKLGGEVGNGASRKSYFGKCNTGERNQDLGDNTEKKKKKERGEKTPGGSPQVPVCERQEKKTERKKKRTPKLTYLWAAPPPPRLKGCRSRR